MKNSPNRVARLTSSNIYKIIPFGSREMTEEELKLHKKEFPKSKKKNIEDGFSDGGITYLKERVAEFELGRGVEKYVYTQDMAWGKLWERYVNSILPLEYEMIIDKTTIHPNYPFWSGSQDFNKHIDGGCIAELKCYQLKKFHAYSRCLMKKDIQSLKENFKQEYWQIVSNSCINNTKYGEAISFMPTQKQLEEMRDRLENTDYIVKELKDDEWKYRFILEKDLYDLPFIPEHSDFPNLVKFQFEVPLEDKELLTERVEKAIYLINNDDLLF